MLSGSNPYFGWADLSGAGYQAMAEQLRERLPQRIELVVKVVSDENH